MIPVNGIILVLSCQKHLHTRLKHFHLPKDEYVGWKVIYVIGDLFLDCDYKLEGNFMIVKCEDSYIHLLKKLVLSLKYIYQNFDIKEGVLRCGDDLIFNEIPLEKFLLSSKTKALTTPSGDSDITEEIHFIGRSPSGKSLLSHEISDADIKSFTNDRFMIDYYMCHLEDFDNPQHNLKGVDISKYIKRPHIPIGPSGIIYYISNKSCNILINHLDSIKYNIFHYDEYTDSYPYTIEDCAVSYILYYNKVGFEHMVSMFEDYYNNPNKETVIAIHTNYNKY
jgi:hypothetical protein